MLVPRGRFGDEINYTGCPSCSGALSSASSSMCGIMTLKITARQQASKAGQKSELAVLRYAISRMGTQPSTGKNGLETPALQSTKARKSTRTVIGITPRL